MRPLIEQLLEHGIDLRAQECRVPGWRPHRPVQDGVEWDADHAAGVEGRGRGEEIVEELEHVDVTLDFLVFLLFLPVLLGFVISGGVRIPLVRRGERGYVISLPPIIPLTRPRNTPFSALWFLLNIGICNRLFVFLRHLTEHGME